jgi:hypothetical protein
VITPQGLQDRLVGQNAPAVRRALDKIEQALILSAQSTGDATKASASINLGGDLNQSVAEQVCAILDRHGWETRIVDDQRDGNYIHVTYKAPFRPKRVVPMVAESNIVPAYGFPQERLY